LPLEKTSFENFRPTGSYDPNGWFLEVKRIANGWKYDAVSLGHPGLVSPWCTGFGAS